MMYIRHSFRKGDVNELNPEDLASRTLYHRGLVGFILVYHILKCLINSPIYKVLFFMNAIEMIHRVLWNVDI